MKCNYCDYEVREDCVCCPNCGENPKTKKINKIKNEVKSKEKTKTTFDAEKYIPLWGILGFFAPIIGLILFCVWKRTNEKAANAAGIGALSRVILYIFYFSFYSFMKFILSK